MLQDLIETRVGATGADQLGTPAQVAAWLAGHALLPTDLELSAEDRARFAAFRDSLRALVAAGRGPDEKLVERFNRVARGARVDVELGPGGLPRASARIGTLDHAFGRFLGILVNACLDDTWDRLKICANPDCRVAFYDDTRTRARRWCTKRCGDVVRTRRYRKTARYKRLRG